MTLDESGFETVLHSQVATPTDRELRLDDRPAVYAWYRQIDVGNACGSEEEFITAIDGLLSCQLSPSSRTIAGYLYRVSIQESGYGLSTRSQETLRLVAGSAESRIDLACIISAAAILQAPLYVGKATSLRRRIGEHVSGVSGLREELHAAGIAIERCLLRFRYVDVSRTLLRAIRSSAPRGLAPADLLATLVEELLTRLSPAAFVKRPG
jgi:hypothetical protein